MFICIAVTCLDVNLCSLSLRCYVNHIPDNILRYVSRICIYICVYIHKRAGTSDILTSIYTTGLLFFELTFAGTV